MQLVVALGKHLWQTSVGIVLTIMTLSCSSSKSCTTYTNTAHSLCLRRHRLERMGENPSICRHIHPTATLLMLMFNVIGPVAHFLPMSHAIPTDSASGYTYTLWTVAQLQSARFAVEWLIMAMTAHGQRTLLVSRHGVLHAPETERRSALSLRELENCAIFAIDQQGKRHDISSVPR